MSILTCDGISYSIGVKDILNNLTFAVNSGSKVGIIGVNGAGKTTLFSIITGKVDATAGAVYFQKNATYGCLEQINDEKQFTKDVYNTALDAFPDLLRMEADLERLSKEVESGDAQTILRYTELHDLFCANGGNEFRTKTTAILRRFGFSETELHAQANLLSGGQKTKLLLAKLLLREPDIILLDEPTNHLDIEAIEWLENFIRNSKKTFLIVSHDRFFLDRVTTDTMEIEYGKCQMYKGNYTAFREKKRLQQEAQLRHYEQQQKEIARIEAFIENQHRWNREKNIIAAESREKALARMVKIDKPQDAPKGVKFTIAQSASLSNDVLSVRNLQKQYPGEFLFKNLSFEMRRGDRLFIIGPNGTGKSTLLKILTARETADSGIYELGFNQTLGYYDQEQQLLDMKNCVLDELWSVYAEKTMTEVRSMLASFGFRGEDVYKQISVLSGGERARLSIAKMISCGVSLLILDEPTNHLDIASKETLEEALRNYNGTVLTVSHDRYFIKALATGILELNKTAYPDGYRQFRCGYEEYLRIREAEEENAKAEKKETESKLSFEEAKKIKNRRRTAENRFQAVEKEIEETEKKLSENKELQQSEEVMTDYVRLDELSKQEESLQARLDALYEEYDQLEKELSEPIA